MNHGGPGTAVVDDDTRAADPADPADPEADAGHLDHSGIGQPQWARPTLLGLAVLAGLSYTWGARSGSLELYYQAAVRSMSLSWHNFIFGAFDPAGTVSVDKLPGALWVQALSVRLFGFHPWAILLPQMLEGVLTILVLYRAVRRLAGPVAGLVAAGVMAVTPAAVALGRGNISDSLLILLLVLAADATVSALTRRRPGWLLVAGCWVGLAFQAKMMEAWLVLPALGVVWLVAGSGRLARRTLWFGAAVVLAGVVSLSWMSVVSLVPHSQRPYVDGSTSDSLYQQVFVYNGFGRVSTSTPGLTAGTGNGSFTALVDFRLPGTPGAGRLLTGAGGRDIGWLVPLSLVAGATALVSRRRRPRGDPLRAAALLWGTWLVVDLVAFSVLSGINAYYLAALAPAVGGLCGVGVEVVRQHGLRHRKVIAAVLVGAAATGAYGWWLSRPAPAALLVTLAAIDLALLVVGGVLLVGRSRQGGQAETDGTWSRQVVVGLALVLATAVTASGVAAVSLVTDGLGPFDTPYQPASVTRVTQVEPKETLRSLRPGLVLLQQVNGRDRYLSATYTSIIAAPLIILTGQEIEPIGGFTGTIPSPSLGALIHQVRTGQLQTVIAPPVDDARITWVRSHCTVVPPTFGVHSGPIADITIYVCSAR